jgi:DNA-binding XRE family transcriptional regulator
MTPPLEYFTKEKKCEFFIRLEKVMEEENALLKHPIGFDEIWQMFQNYLTRTKAKTAKDSLDDFAKQFIEKETVKGEYESFLPLLAKEKICSEKDIKDAIYSDEFIASKNIVKRTCKEIGLTYKELAEAIGVKESTLNKIASTGEVSDQIRKAISLYLETLELKKQLKDCDILKQALQNLVK